MTLVGFSLGIVTFSEKATFQGGQTAMKWFWYLTYGIGVGAIVGIMIGGFIIS